MVYVDEVRDLLRASNFRTLAPPVGSKISGYGQLAGVAVYFACPVYESAERRPFPSAPPKRTSEPKNQFRLDLLK
jgi:hypothetical protein